MPCSLIAAPRSTMVGSVGSAALRPTTPKALSRIKLPLNLTSVTDLGISDIFVLCYICKYYHTYAYLSIPMERAVLFKKLKFRRIDIDLCYSKSIMRGEDKKVRAKNLSGYDFSPFHVKD